MNTTLSHTHARSCKPSLTHTRICTRTYTCTSTHALVCTLANVCHVSVRAHVYEVRQFIWRAATYGIFFLQLYSLFLCMHNLLVTMVTEFISGASCLLPWKHCSVPLKMGYGVRVGFFFFKLMFAPVRVCARARVCLPAESKGKETDFKFERMKKKTDKDVFLFYCVR